MRDRRLLVNIAPLKHQSPRKEAPLISLRPRTIQGKTVPTRAFDFDQRYRKREIKAKEKRRVAKFWHYRKLTTEKKGEFP